jgi:Acetyltransferase (GNAT) domain
MLAGNITAGSGIFSGSHHVNPASGGAATIAAQWVNPVHFPNWDALMISHSNYSFFYGTAWARVLEDTYGYSPVYLTAEGSGVGRFLLPLMEINSWLTGRRGVALPFTDVCGPLYEDAALARDMVQSSFELGKSRGWKTIEFRGGKELFPEAPASLSFYGHSLNLDKNEGLLFARLDGSVRRAIRKAEKSGLTVTVSQELDAMKTFYSLQCKTRRKHGLAPQPFSFFRNIYRHVLSKQLGMVVIASYENSPVAASVYFQLGGRAIYKFGASDDAFQQWRGVNLVMWEAIKWLARNGVKTLDLGRTSIGNEGLRRFKLNWGAQEEKIEYFKYDLRRNIFVVETDAVTGWYNRVFRALPIGVSRMIGATLYRHLA